MNPIRILHRLRAAAFGRLALKIALAIVVMETLVLGGLGWWYVVRFADSVDRRVIAQARLPGTLMSQGSLRYAAVCDLPALSRLVQQDVAVAMVLRVDGEVFEASHSAMIGHSISAAVPQFEFPRALVADHRGNPEAAPAVPAEHILITTGAAPMLVHLSPLEHDGRHIGWLYLRVSTAAAAAEKRRLSWQYGLSMLASIAATSLAQIALVTGLVGPRVRRTAAVLAQARAGDLSVRIGSRRSPDELGRLQNDVDAMLAETEARANALSVSENRYRLLVEHQSDLVMRIDHDGRLIYVSPTFCKTFGQTFSHNGDSLPDSSFLTLVHDEDRQRAQAALRQLDQHQPSLDRELQCLTIQGGRWFNWRLTVLPDDNAMGKPSIIGVGRDITRQRELEGQLRHAQKMEAIGQLAGGIAHDFNNMLTGIMGGAELLARRFQTLPPDALERRHVELIMGGAERAADLTRKLLAFARRTPSTTTTFDLRDCITAALGLLERSVDRGITITTRLAPAPVLGDKTLLQNAFLNLGLNARDAMPHGGVLTVVCQTVTLTSADLDQAVEGAPGTWVEVLIADTGCGIQPEQLTRIFEPFFTTKPLGKGTGLGLSAVYSTVREHAGFIRVDSSVGSGSEFRIFIPATTYALASAPLPLEREPTHGHGTILVIEDEPLLRDLVQALLEELGYEAVLAADGNAGIAAAAAANHGQHLTTVLLDLMMPGLNGRETFARLRQQHPTLPVIVCTGFDRQEGLDDLLAAGVAAILHKPYQLDELATVIARCARPTPTSAS